VVGKGTAIDPLRALQDALLVAFVVTIIVTDWRWRRIPNVVTYPTMLAGLALATVESFPGQTPFGAGLLDHAAALVLAFLLAWPFYAGGGMKAGDGKFLMAVGALRGMAFLLQAAIWGALLGGVIAIVFLVGRRIASRRAGAPAGLGALLHSWIPYGVALGLGALVALGLEISRLS
jgi:prepilin peptidase CpaA